MEVPDCDFMTNFDWDPAYLKQLFTQDFYDFRELWNSNIPDEDLVTEMNKVERYSPIVEDISLDDTVLCTAVEKIEQE